MACTCRSELHLLGASPGGASMAFPEPGVGPRYAPSRTFRIDHAHVWLRLDPPAKRYEGRTRFTIAALPSWQGTARFDLGDVAVDAVTDGEGAPLPHRRGDATLEVDAGDARELVIAYGGPVPAAGLYATGPEPFAPDRPATMWTQCQDEDAHFFMPCLDHPRVRHPWTIELEGPAGCTLLSNGARGASGERDGWAYATFEQRDPMPAYLFTAVCAPLDVVEDASGPVPLRFLVPADRTEPIPRTFGKTGEMIEVFRRFTGVDFPWPRYDQVVVDEFVFGGMENTACTTMTDVLLVDADAARHWDPERLVAHELAHQWFGDLVTCIDWSHAWLNESFATFLESVWHRHRHGDAEDAWYAFGQAEAYVSEDAERYRRPIVDARFREPIDVFDRHLYEKGAVVLRTLRAELGEEAFAAGIRAYLDAHAHRSVHTHDLQTALEDATGQNLEGFFDAWVRGAGHPVLTVALAEEPGLVLVTVTQTQTGEDTAEAFPLRLALELVRADGTVARVRLPVRERERTWAVPVDGPVAHVRVDPGFSVLAEITLEAPLPWLAALTTDPCPVLAARAARALARRSGPRAFELLRTMSEHPFWGVRAEVAKRLGARKGDAARDALLARLDAEEEPRVREALVQALASFAEDAAVGDALLGVIDGDDTAHVCGAALDSLGAIRDPRAVARLSAAVGTASWADLVTVRALSGLGKTRDEGAFPVLRGWLAPTRSDRVRAGAAKGLGLLAEGVPDVRRSVCETLAEALHSAGFRLQLAALSALGSSQAPEAIPTLEHWRRAGADGRVRRTAYEALVKAREATGAEATALAGRLDRLDEDQRKLRSRLDRLERADVEVSDDPG